MSDNDRGAAFPANCAVLDLRLAEWRQLFDSMDPAPFRQRDLDPRAEEYIVEWAQDVRADRPLALIIHLDQKAGTFDEDRVLPESVHAFFKVRAAAARRRLRQLLQEGRRSLLISLVFLAAMVVVGDLLTGLITRERSGEILKESLLIGGWVAMWRPLEIFLYGWWPIRVEARLCDRLSGAFVHVVHGADVASNAATAEFLSETRS
jgi:hypothetical protein